jgi:hypothetical protein
MRSDARSMPRLVVAVDHRFSGSPFLRELPRALHPIINFMNRINLLLPVQSLPEKYSPSHFPQISLITPPSRSSRGALAIVTNVGTGCGGRGSVGRAIVVAGRFSVSDRGARTNDVASVFTNASAVVHMPPRPLAKTGRGRQNRVVLAPVAGAKSAEVLRAQPGLATPLIRRRR